tara:strand:- start:505 stop:636 length:132 start_codon:yes stop_codon:yes gene_type:complete
MYAELSAVLIKTYLLIFFCFLINNYLFVVLGFGFLDYGLGLIY